MGTTFSQAKEKLDLVCPKEGITQKGLDDPSLCGVDGLQRGWGEVVRTEEASRYHLQRILGSKSSMAVDLKIFQNHPREKSQYFDLCQKQRAPESDASCSNRR